MNELEPLLARNLEALGVALPSDELAELASAYAVLLEWSETLASLVTPQVEPMFIPPADKS
jgi:hypothetical protein